MTKQVLLVTLWRSGTHWLANMTSELIGAPKLYQADDLKDYSEETLSQIENFPDRAVLIRHLSTPPQQIIKLLKKKKIKAIFLYRDPRDVLASQVNMRKFREEVKPNLPNFPKMSFDKILEWELSTYKNTYKDLLVQWATIKSFSIYQVKYEQLISDPVKELSKICKFLQVKTDTAKLKKIVEANSFKNVTNRNKGEEDKSSHNRKGIVGDYKFQFTPKQQQKINKLLRKTLISLDYEI